jgi:hypothetical protein
MTLLHLVFLLVALFSVYVQAKSYGLARALDENAGLPASRAEYERLLRARRLTSPAVAALTALLVGLGAFVWQGTSPYLGGLLTSVWACAALGDVFVEGSYSTDEPATKARFYVIGMLLFVVVTLGLGAGLGIHAVWLVGISTLQLGVGIGLSMVMGLVAYRTLDVDRERFPLLVGYTFCVSTLLCGGVLSAFAGYPRLAYIGTAYFVSDWCVGLRDFGKPVPALLHENLLVLILALYYSIMLVSIDLAL